MCYSDTEYTHESSNMTMLPFASGEPYFFLVDALAVLTILGNILVPLLVFLLVWEIASKKGCFMITRFLSRHALLLMLIVAMIGTTGSLYFSEIMLWHPCRFCWIQRLFMYPQVFLLGLALILHDRGIARYILLFSALGMLAAGWHYEEQVMAILYPAVYDVMEPCDATGVSCKATEILYFGYITIPVMAFTAFALNALGSIAVLRERSIAKRTQSGDNVVR